MLMTVVIGLACIGVFIATAILTILALGDYPHKNSGTYLDSQGGHS